MKTALICLALYHAAVLVLVIYLAGRVPKADHVVKASLANMVLGIVGMLFLSGMFALLATEDDAIWGVSFVMVFNLLGVSLIVGYYNCRTWVRESSILQKNFWGRTREIPFRDIVKLEEDRGIIRVCSRHSARRLEYGKADVHGEAILEILRTQVSREQLAHDQPVSPVRPFRDSIYDASGMYAGWGIGFGVFGINLGLGIWMRFLPWVLVSLGILAFWGGYVALAVYSAKRAHASEKWASVAAHCFKPGYLKP